MLAVVFFHADLGVTGGYVGVDVFFVISGFLITSLIIKDLQNGKFTLVNFWERRARRIVPAMLVVVFTTLAAGWFLLLPSDYMELGRSAAWQAVFGANIHFWLNTGYFAGPAEEQALLHTWSLAVEEQFYMVVPLLLLGLFRIPAFRSRNIMLLMFAAGIAISLAISIYGVERHPSAAFYLLPARAWELLCGAFVALVPPVWLPRSRLSRESLSLLGLVSILLPFWLYTKTTPFPGLAAVLPCFGTAMFIWASSSDHGSTPGKLPAVARLLSMRPIVFIGIISYSLYLWHWPFFAFSSYWELEPRSSTYSLVIVLISFLFAVLTWRYVETPFRKRIICSRRTTMFAFGVVGMTLVLVLGISLTTNHGFPSRLPAQAIAYGNAKQDRAGIHELTAADIRHGRLIRIGNQDSRVPISLLLWGDSHAMAASPAFDQFLKGEGLAGLQATASATAPVLGAYWQNEFTNPKEAEAFNDAVFSYVKQHRISNVILVAYWEYYSDDKGSTSLDSALISTVKQLVDAGAQPWILLQVPHPGFDVPKGLAKRSIFNSDLSHLLAAPVGWNGLRGDGEFLLNKIEAAGAHILDPRPCFMNSAQSNLLVEKSGIALYRDDHHLSATGAKMVLAPFLSESLHLKSAYAGDRDPRFRQTMTDCGASVEPGRN